MVVATMDESWGIPIGTDVYTAEGEHLGSVVEGDSYDLLVEHGKLVLSLTREQAENERKVK